VLRPSTRATSGLHSHPADHVTSEPITESSCSRNPSTVPSWRTVDLRFDVLSVPSVLMLALHRAWSRSHCKHKHAGALDHTECTAANFRVGGFSPSHLRRMVGVVGKDEQRQPPDRRIMLQRTSSADNQLAQRCETRQMFLPGHLQIFASGEGKHPSELSIVS